VLAKATAYGLGAAAAPDGLLLATVQGITVPLLGFSWCWEWLRHSLPSRGRTHALY